MTAPRSKWLTALAAAEYLGCSRRHIYDLAARGALRVSRINQRGDIRTCEAWLDSYVEAAAPESSNAHEGGTSRALSVGLGVGLTANDRSKHRAQDTTESSQDGRPPLGFRRRVTS